MAALWTAAIYSTLYVARPATEFLRERNLLRLAVWAVIALLGVAVLAWTARRRLPAASLGVLAAGAVVFVGGVLTVSPAEVKLHFVQYGVLGGLLWGAWHERGSRWAPLWALVVTAAAGWVDEGIQYLLPNRYYDLLDVALNAFAGAIAIGTLEGVARTRGVVGSEAGAG